MQTLSLTPHPISLLSFAVTQTTYRQALVILQFNDNNLPFILRFSSGWLFWECEQFVFIPSHVNIAILVTRRNRQIAASCPKKRAEQLFVSVFVSHTGIDSCGLSPRIMLLRNNTLRIVNSSRADEGNYVCRAENQLGSAEMTAVLWVKGKWCPGGLFYFLPN